MPQPKLALTWGDVLAIALVALLGAGAARLASALVDARMREGRPSADSYRERESVELREGELARAKDAHDMAWRALVAQRLESARRRALASARASASAPLAPLVVDSATRVEGALSAEVASAATVSGALRDSLAQARRRASKAFRADSGSFEDHRQRNATLAGALAAALVVVLATLVLSGRPRDGEAAVHARRVALVASSVLVLVLGYRYLVSS